MTRIFVVMLIALGSLTARADELPPAPAAEVPPVGLPASVTPSDYPALAGRSTVTVPDFVLPDGRSVTLDLSVVQPFARRAELILETDAGPLPLAPPDLVVLSGGAREIEAAAFLAITPESIHGFVRTASGDFLVSSGPPGRGLVPLIFDPREVPPEWLAADPFTCHYAALDPPAGGGGGPAYGMRGTPCRIAQIAIETDWEFRQLFGSEGAAAAYATTLIAAVSEIFVGDTNLHLEISYLRIWNTSGDPWSSTSLPARLIEFRNYWNTNMSGVSRHVAHLLSGQSKNDGLAYGDAACLAGFDYGISSGIDGSFPYPLTDNHMDNWDLYIAAHELGHSFGNPHTHAIGIDDCANGDCSVTPNGTLMSYCNLCPGGMANLLLNFHPTMLANETLPFLASGQCVLDANAPLLVDDPNGGTVCGGDAIILTAAWTSGGATTAQWRKDGIDIVGATSDTLTIAVADPNDSGTYDLVVSNACGSVTSAAAAIVVCGGSSADIDGDCDVDLSDLATLLGNFGDAGASPSDGDVNGDGLVNLSDLAEMLAEFGVGC